MQKINLKKIIQNFTPKMVPEGQGAEVLRVIGTSKLRTMDPFLMLGITNLFFLILNVFFKVFFFFKLSFLFLTNYLNISIF